MAVRNATFEDMALAAEIMVTSFRTAFADFVSRSTMDACTNPENCRAMLESIFREGKIHFLMGGEQGFLCWQEAGDGAEIVAIHSLPESWGTGLGHAMLTQALEQIGDRPVYLWAFKENARARRFYEKHGFRWDGTERISEFDGAVEVRYMKNKSQPGPGGRTRRSADSNHAADRFCRTAGKVSGLRYESGNGVFGEDQVEDYPSRQLLLFHPSRRENRGLYPHCRYRGWLKKTYITPVHNVGLPWQRICPGSNAGS